MSSKDTFGTAGRTFANNEYTDAYIGYAYTGGGTKKSFLNLYMIVRYAYHAELRLPPTCHCKQAISEFVLIIGCDSEIDKRVATPLEYSRIVPL